MDMSAMAFVIGVVLLLAGVALGRWTATRK